MVFNNWQFWVGWGISALFLIILLLFIDPGELSEALRSANYLYIIPALGLYFTAVYFRAARWRYLLMPVRSLPVGRLYPVVIIGYTANNLLPARLGELVRAYFLAQREPVSGSSALATIGVERVYDGLTLLAFAAVSAPLLLLLGSFEGTGSGYQTTALVFSAATAGLFVGALVFLTLLAVEPRSVALIQRMLQFLPARLRPLAQDLTQKFVLGLTTLSSPKQHLSLFLRSLPIWVLEGGMYLIIAYSFGIDGYFSSLGVLLLAVALVTATSNLITALPASIGGIGPFEVVAQQTLVGLGVGASVAASYAVVLHLVALWLPVNLAGLILLWRQNLSFRQLTRNRGDATREQAESYSSTLPQPKEDLS
ncbi:MAG: lysylphosphatidylglycerol synthase transmembrane domain-containing protein [Dehalococcoidia bacterium]